MKNRKQKALIWTVAGVIAVFLTFLLSSTWAGSVPASPSVDELRAEVEILHQEQARLEEENRGIRKILEEQEDGELYVVVDTESNRLTPRQREMVFHTAVVGTGSRQFIKAETGTNWFFETPMGSFTVLGKERNPVWIRPDWSYVEENMPIPPPRDPDRLVRDVLGKYALLLGNGYKIHGTKWTKLLGTHFTHGCVSLGAKDLEIVYKSVKIGTKVYLF
jgi:L,D-transpeptidase ErfK/SrfK